MNLRTLSRWDVSAVFAPVIADFVTKVVAYRSLPLNEGVPVVPRLWLYLTVNHTGISTQYLHFGYSVMQLNLGSFAAVVTGAFVLWIRGRSIGSKWKIGLAAVMWVGTAMLALAIGETLPGGTTYLWRVFQGASRLFLLAVLFAVGNQSLFRVPLLLAFAGVLGNTLSLFYSPFGAIDFIYWEPLNSWVGKGSFNLADGIQDVAMLCAAIAASGWCLRRAYQALTKRLRRHEIPGCSNS